MKPGEDFRILTVSFDRHDTLQTAAAFREQLGPAGQFGWCLDVRNIQERRRPERQTERVGFKFFWSPQDKSFVHPGAYLFFSPEGRLSRVLYQQDAGSRDVELALLDANIEHIRATEISNLLLNTLLQLQLQGRQVPAQHSLVCGSWGVAVRGADYDRFIGLLQIQKEGESYERGRSCTNGLIDCCWAQLALLTASLPAMAAESKIISPTHMWNEIWTEVLYDLLLIGVPFGLAALYMMIRYRAKSPGQVGEAVNLSAAATWGWIIVPCALVPG